MSRHWIQLTGAAVLGFLVAGCTATTHVATLREHGARGKHAKQVAIASLPTEIPQLTFLRDAAAFSAAVYVDAPLTQPLADVKLNGTPEQKEELALLPTSGWLEHTDIPRTGIPGKRQTPDLTYRLWISTNRSPKVAMLVFRGTHIPADWYSNLRWIDSWIPHVEDHYEQTIRITPEIVNYIRSTSGSSAIILTAGHSLGGGLAQSAAYKACGAIRDVYAFDSTPVTKNRVRLECPPGDAPENFYRVFEQSEILSYVRFVVRLVLGLREADPHIMEVKVHLFEGVGVRAHSMRKLATRLDHELTVNTPAGIR